MAQACDDTGTCNSTNGFTIGKWYDVIRPEGNGYIVRNDNGHERFILSDGKVSAHLLHTWNVDYGRHRMQHQQPVGYFKVEDR
jgi:hypothetical protein